MAYPEPPLTGTTYGRNDLCLLAEIENSYVTLKIDRAVIQLTADGKWIGVKTRPAQSGWRRAGQRHKFINLLSIINVKFINLVISDCDTIIDQHNYFKASIEYVPVQSTRQETRQSLRQHSQLAETARTWQCYRIHFGPT